MATNRRSGRSSACTWRSQAMPRSLSRPRSWTSSKMTVSARSTNGSDVSQRSSMPSVRTTMRVSGPIRRSKRTCRAHGVAHLLAELRRHALGRRIGQRPAGAGRARPCPRVASKIAGGTRVVLPAPVGACTTTLPCSWARDDLGQDGVDGEGRHGPWHGPFRARPGTRRRARTGGQSAFLQQRKPVRELA